jgi:anti-sigma regulatory factor (Ser/Thr protein kinase)
VRTEQRDGPRDGAHEVRFSASQLGALRRVVSSWAGGEGLPPTASEELVLAINELATNSILYGGGEGTLLRWRDSDALVCEIRDNGQIEDPLAGTHLPDPSAQSGRGLWLVRQLCDAVQIETSPRGTVVRVQKLLPNA